jgi:energy-coupling factor transporter ATP-binding protein EcfA2
MKISQIKISSILGLDELELTPGGFTEITGQNGTGKTSVIESIKAALKTGHDATLLRAGAESGEVVLVLDDGMSITRKVTADDTKTEVRGADGKKMSRPADTIKKLTDMLSVNPVEFLAAPKKDRTRVLLESMPLTADVERLTKLSGIKVTAEPGVHALQVIEVVAKQVYDERTGTNRAVKEKEAAINQLTQAMPDAPAGVAGDENDIAAKIEEARAARDTMFGKIDTKLAGIKSKAQQDIDAIRTQLQADMDRLKAEAQAKVDVINLDVQDNVARATTARENAANKFTETTTPLNTALELIRADRSSAAKREQALEMIGTMNEELAGLRADAAAQTKALDDIDAYKLELLAGLPIPGLEVRDGEIYRHGVIFDRINTAGQVAIAVEIAKLRAGELGIVCLDRAECLDSASLDALRDSIVAAGLQGFITRVGDGDFEISTTER